MLFSLVHNENILEPATYSAGLAAGCGFVSITVTSASATNPTAT